MWLLCSSAAAPLWLWPKVTWKWTMMVIFMHTAAGLKWFLHSSFVKMHSLHPKILSVPASCDFVRELDDPVLISLCFMLRPEGWLLHVARGSPHTEMDFSQNTILLLYVLFIIKVGYILFCFISTNTGRIQVTCTFCAVPISLRFTSQVFTFVFCLVIVSPEKMTLI